MLVLLSKIDVPVRNGNLLVQQRMSKLSQWGSGRAGSTELARNTTSDDMCRESNRTLKTSERGGVEFDLVRKQKELRGRAGRRGGRA